MIRKKEKRFKKTGIKSWFRSGGKKDKDSHKTMPFIDHLEALLLARFV